MVFSSVHLKSIVENVTFVLEFLGIVAVLSLAAVVVGNYITMIYENQVIFHKKCVRDSRLILHKSLQIYIYLLALSICRVRMRY